MEILSLAGGNLVSAAFDSLFEKLNGYLSDQLRDSKEEVRAQMKHWKTLLPKITAVLQHAEENQDANQFMKLYLDDLRDLAYDMEDILEEFVIDAKMSELIAKSEARPNKRPKITFSVMNLFISEAKPNQEINYRLKGITSKLQQIEKATQTLGPINSAMEVKKKSHKVAAERLIESSLLEDKVLGRDVEKDAILQRLLEDGGSLKQDLVIPIVGMGGVGKTTLAQLVYNDKKLEGRFDLKAWVCVSVEFDVDQITRIILEHVTGERSNLQSSTLVQEELKRKLSGCKFLVVLDDVWNVEYRQWDVLMRPFMSGAPGSKIIVTTRNKDVGTMMRGDDEVYNLELLQDDACLPLFTRHALRKENFDAHPDLQDVGEKLVERCKKLPLALKTLGGVLRGKLHRDEWENILNSEIWSHRSGILPTLRLSYNHLSLHLKRCFAYCALFPKDYEFDKEKLVLLWMAEGLLQQQSHGKKQMEKETGYGYFEELLSRSLFQQSSGNESRFVMHDLINDLAVNVAGEIYCNLERSIGDEKLEKARHLSFIPHCYETYKRFRVLEKLKHLRTFIPLQEPSVNVVTFSLPGKVLHDILPTLNRLRVLSLCKCSISKLPDSFENLKHVRYIDLSHTGIICLPESVGSLLFLQTLLLRGCYCLSTLPKKIGNLIDLHHLDVSYTLSLKEMPAGIGNLKNLLTMSKFIVGKASGLMRLYDLKNLSQLRGKLSIQYLQNVLDVQDAREANLEKIHGLKELILEWTTSDNDRDELVFQAQVLFWLKPHSNLESLKISCYGGQNFPNWVCDPLLFLKLSSMELSNCKRCTLLPSLGQLPILKKLIIKGMKAIKAVGSEFYGGHNSFPSLEELLFENMLNWKEWTSPAGSDSKFPCLVRLVIQNCPELLGQLPSNLSLLKEFVIPNCPKLSGQLPSNLSSLEKFVILNCPKLLGQSPSNLSSLKELDVTKCNAMLLKRMVDLTSLTNLRIVNILELTCLPKSFIQSLTALETLHVAYCDDLTCLWEEGAQVEQSLLPFINLKHLWLWGCGALETLPNAMMVQMDGSSSSNPSKLMLRLKKLEIFYCDSLKSFPRGKLPISLEYLRIECCKSLESLPDADGDNNSNLHLEIKNLPCLYSSQGRHQLPAYLKKFEVNDRESVESFSTRMKLQGRLASYPSQALVFQEYRSLESFPERMLQDCRGLQSISISGCKILKSLPTLDGVSNLVELDIYNCEVLESLPELGLCTPNLKEFKIHGCKNLKSVPNTMYQLKSLQRLIVRGCENLKSLPNTMYQLKSLQYLAMSICPSIEFIPDGGLPLNLTELRLSKCENLKSMPNTMYQLKSLQKLAVQDCPSIEIIPDRGLPPNLVELQLLKCKNLKSVPNTMYQLTSLQRLTIPGGALTMGLQNLTSLQHLSIDQKFPLNIVLPSSLTHLSIENEENLKYIPGRIFQNLNSFKSLSISDCPKLRSLPREAFPPSLGGLSIKWCPLLKRQRFQAKGDYWTLTRGIPYVEIY